MAFNQVNRGIELAYGEHVVLVAALDPAQIPQQKRRHVKPYYHAVKLGHQRTLAQSLLPNGFLHVEVASAVAKHEGHCWASLGVAHFAFRSGQDPNVPLAPFTMVIQDYIIDPVLLLAANFHAKPVKTRYKNPRLKFERRFLASDVQQ